MTGQQAGPAGAPVLRDRLGVERVCTAAGLARTAANAWGDDRVVVIAGEGPDGALSQVAVHVLPGSEWSWHSHGRPHAHHLQYMIDAARRSVSGHHPIMLVMHPVDGGSPDRAVVCDTCSDMRAGMFLPVAQCAVAAARMDGDGPAAPSAGSAVAVAARALLGQLGERGDDPAEVADALRAGEAMERVDAHRLANLLDAVVAAGEPGWWTR